MFAEIKKKFWQETGYPEKNTQNWGIINEALEWALKEGGREYIEHNVHKIKDGKRTAYVLYGCDKCGCSTLTAEAFRRHKCEDYPLSADNNRSELPSERQS